MSHKTCSMEQPLRIKIGVLILLLVGLVSIFQIPDIQRIRALPPNEVVMVYHRAQCLEGALPAGVHLFGFLPPVDLIVHTRESAFAAAENMRRLFLTRSVVAPRLIAQAPQQEWVIAYFSDAETGRKSLAGQPFTVVKDCENGVFLLKR
jgi:hypothetical protein